MSTVLIRLPDGEGVVRRDVGALEVTRDVSDDRGQRFGGRDDYRPVTTRRDQHRCVVYDEVLPTDGSRGGHGGHGDDGPLRQARQALESWIDDPA